MLTEGSTLELTIEKPVAGGRMLARHDGQVVLVAGALPGERVRARIERLTRGLAFATTMEVLQPAAGRRTPTGDPLCGGNVYAHVAYAEQAAIKREVLRDALRHGGRIDWPGELPVTSSPEHGYRMRARLHVRGGRVGFFREGTHDLCDSAATGQLLPASVDAVQRFVDATPGAVCDAIDALELSESLTGDQRTLHVQWMPNTRVPRVPFDELWPLDRLAGLTGISCDDPAAAAAFGHDSSIPPRTIAGQPWVSDPLDAFARASSLATPARAGRASASTDTDAQGTARLQRHATSFFQANRYLVPALVAAVHRVVLPLDADADDHDAARIARAGTGPLIDLYAGVGLFAVTLAARGVQSIVAVEGDPSSARDLDVNAQPFTAQIRIERTSVERYLDRAVLDPPASATVIVDPPRTGLSRQALDALLRLHAARLIYVSCDVATLSRDLRRAIDAGYRLDHVEAFDLFPNTAHVESLAVLTKPASE